MQFNLKFPHSVILLLFCLFFSSIALANEPKTYDLEEHNKVSGPTYYSVQIENDFFAASGDRLYTHGASFSIMPQGEAAPDWLQEWATWIPLFQQTKKTVASYELGQKVFTPEATWVSDLQKNDQPYAGWLYGSVSIFSPLLRDKYLFSANALTFTFGLVGPAAMGKEFQNGFHSVIGDEPSQGWDNQIKNELGFNVTYLQKWAIQQKHSNLGLSYEIGPHVALALGNIYRYASGGVMMRVGKTLHVDLGPPTIAPGFPGAAFFSPALAPSWYFFAGYESRIINWNIFLDGNSYTSSHHVDKEPIVGDFQMGAVFQWPGWRISLSNMIRGKEFKSQSDATRYGAFNVSWAY